MALFLPKLSMRFSLSKIRQSGIGVHSSVTKGAFLWENPKTDS